jgi:hypothetical protein
MVAEHPKRGRLFWLLEVMRPVIITLPNHVRRCRRVPDRSLPMSSRRILFMSWLVVALAGGFSAVGALAPAELPKPKDGPLGMKFMPLPKGTFYMGWDGRQKGVKTEIKEDFEIAIHTVTDQGGLRDRHPHGDAGTVAGSDGQEPELFLPRRQRESQGQGHQG